MDDLVRECKPDLRALLRPHGTQETAYPAAGNETRIFPKVTHRRMRLSACHSVQVGAQDATQNSVGPTQPCTRWIRRSRLAYRLGKLLGGTSTPYPGFLEVTGLRGDYTSERICRLVTEASWWKLCHAGHL